MYNIIRVKKAAVFHNTARLTAQEVKTQTGCTHILNGYYFNNKKTSPDYFKPLGWLVIDGDVLSTDKWRDWGFGVGADGIPVMTTDRNGTFIGSLPLLKDGVRCERTLTADIKGPAARTAVGWTTDGRIILWCDKEKLLIPELVEKLLALGAVDAIAMDGGGSTQGIFPDGKVTSTRKVPTFLLLWEDADTVPANDPEEESAMTEQEIRKQVVAKAKSYLGCKESDGSHKKIIDLYNRHKPLARSYAVKYTDEWCATFVSAVGIALGYTDIMPTECSCAKMIELYKAKGHWKENDAHVPSPGDIVMYDWQDKGTGDNTGHPDHVGFVVSLNGTAMTIIEGNKGEAVAYRSLNVNGKYIRGYCLPNYASKSTAPPVAAQKTSGVNVPTLRLGASGDAVVALQAILTARGHNTKGIDGDFGPNTENAVKSYQRAHKLEDDGVVGKNTWSALLGIA